MSEFLTANGQPDWELIREQMWLYGAKDGLKAKEVKREVNEEFRKMKQEWRETGQIKGWIEPQSTEASLPVSGSG